ncbi:hypothetical protein BKA66DRAFT_434926 [Pyrenochaeta sp. MPI-SDFR-AT-0127]|nr:hypothetical protein BKA66DRAFT_434926 [Pyrenochaeta sp. MPI-SDFR-AT-0127]
MTIYVRSARHPSIPSEVAADDVIAIVSIYHPQASNANRNTPFSKAQLNSYNIDEGCHIFLHRIDGQPCFSIGRGDTKTQGSSSMETRDVYLPGTTSGMKQFLLVPVWDSNIWRLQSTTETLATVNGVPIQAYTNRTKQNKVPLPHAVHLKQASVNRVIVNQLQIDIWILKSVHQVYPTSVFTPEPLMDRLQDFTSRSENWAHDRYLLGSQQVSAHSYRVVEQFTGAVQTAKLFRDEQDGRQLRDSEFLRFSKKEVDASIVRYLQSVQVDNIPAIITCTHEGFASYAALQAKITKLHPGLRFAIATKLLRRLFSALEFMHFHNIVHGNVSHESVLLRLVDNKVDSVLLVNYTDATPFRIGAPPPYDDMVEDSRAAMVIIENCCDIWQLRKAATEDAISEVLMRGKTETAKRESDTVQRVVSDFFEIQRGSRTSEKGKKLLRLLEQKQNRWHICQNDQIHNATRREVSVCYKSNIDAMARDWNSAHSPEKIGEKIYFNLSLGHPWFDSLASKLYQQRWETTPRDICTKFKELAGDIEEPWQPFRVETTTTFEMTETGLNKECVTAWLAGYCEAYPEWRPALETEYKCQVESQGSTILREDLGKLRDALAKHGSLPSSMAATFDRLTSDDSNCETSISIKETHCVWLHAPSRMFNLTQLQHLASVDRFLSCVNDGRIRCDNYVEVRGEPKLQGCYVPLSLLSDFASELGVTVQQIPDCAPSLPTLDPSDFSQVTPTKIVLARIGLVAFASVTRTGDQYVFHAPRVPQEFATRHAFLPTYFGDMKVLPQLSEGMYEYIRPDHWSKFQTAEEIENAAISTSRKTSALSRLLDRRQQLRSQVSLSTKRNTEAHSDSDSRPALKRSRSFLRSPNLSALSKPPDAVTMSFINRAAERMEHMAQGGTEPDRLSLSIPRVPNTSFYQRNSNVNDNVVTSPPRSPVDKNQSFTVASGSFDLEDDWKQAEEWLKQVPNDDEEEQPALQGLLGFRFHHSHLESEVDTEEDATSAKEHSDSGKTKTAPQSFVATEQTDPPEPILDGLQSFTPDESAEQAAPSIPGPGVPNRIYNDPNGPIQGWFSEQANAVLGDDDMPDTDVESWGEDNEQEA